MEVGRLQVLRIHLRVSYFSDGPRNATKVDNLTPRCRHPGALSGDGAFVSTVSHGSPGTTLAARYCIYA